MASSSAIEIDEEIEGEQVGTSDYFFERIGEPVPIKPSPFGFDSQSLPTQPLAVSERRGLVFLALSSGFCVARTEELIALALEIKESGKASSSVQQCSVVDVPLREVQILALSFDDSTLAAAVGGDVHFFSVDSLLADKAPKPSFTCSVDEPSCVKDIKWRKKSENSYLVLSDFGKLYCGTVGGPMKDVMEDVDAVDWSVKGNYIALAKEDTLRILSSKFKERLCMVLPFKSWIGDSDASCTVKVDSIRWVRPDSIILGCFQLTDDENEENYLVQVIKSKEGKFSDNKKYRSALKSHPSGSSPANNVRGLTQTSPESVSITSESENPDLGLPEFRDPTLISPESTQIGPNSRDPDRIQLELALDAHRNRDTQSKSGQNHLRMHPDRETQPHLCSIPSRICCRSLHI
ncbi:hypothetical protein L484_005150 [Morus notabilis]|uniref:Nucleoporin Nup159/Nup146 N-terminal domain-containing protein n=1 Tax=Morus notabilis TaxID=981085 RepID=W9RF09_9ROSA|nr:hypothetical protein L484_005150 [Morus notabilis]